jgi:hypothetical protein
MNGTNGMKNNVSSLLGTQDLFTCDFTNLLKQSEGQFATELKFECNLTGI